MESLKDIWALVIALAAVINGLGIVRLVGGFADYLKNHATLNIQHYWVYTLLAVFQLLAHLLLWWSILGVKTSIDNINFLSFLYLVIGPTLLYFATSIMVPDIKDKPVDLRTEYYNFRKTFFSILIIFWLWAIFIWPVFGHSFSPTVPLIAVWLFISLVLRLTDKPKVHAALIVANCVVYVAFIAIYAMQLGEVGRLAVQ
jgi:hypothetical protein